MPGLALLIKDVQRLVAQLGKFSAPAGTTLDGVVVENLAHDEDLLALIDLVPDRLQHLAKGGTLAVAPMHQLRHVGQADITAGQFFVIEDPQPACAHMVVALERKIHLLDAQPLRIGAKLGLGAAGATTEKDTTGCVHLIPSILIDCHSDVIEFESPGRMSAVALMNWAQMIRYAKNPPSGTAPCGIVAIGRGEEA